MNDLHVCIYNHYTIYIFAKDLFRNEMSCRTVNWSVFIGLHLHYGLSWTQADLPVNRSYGHLHKKYASRENRCRFRKTFASYSCYA